MKITAAAGKQTGTRCEDNGHLTKEAYLLQVQCEWGTIVKQKNPIELPMNGTSVHDLTETGPLNKLDKTMATSSSHEYIVA